MGWDSLDDIAKQRKLRDNANYPHGGGRGGDNRAGGKGKDSCMQVAAPVVVGIGLLAWKLLTKAGVE